MTRQLKIVLGDNLRQQLDKASAVSGNSLAEEIRRRVEGSFAKEDVIPWRFDIIELGQTFQLLAMLSELTTGKKWHDDSTTAFLLKLAIDAHLDRHGAKEVAEIQVTEGFKRFGLAASADPKVIAAAMEFLVNFRFANDERGRNTRSLLETIYAVDYAIKFGEEEEE